MIDSMNWLESYARSATTYSLSSPVYEFLSLSDIVFLPSGQPESQRVAESVDTDMDLCAEPTSAATEGLRCLSSFFLTPPQRKDGPARPCCR